MAQRQLTVEEAKKRAILKQRVKGDFADAKDKAPVVRQGFELPDKIKNGSARFAGYTFDLTETGDPMFQLKFVCLEPQEVEGRQFRLAHFINNSQWSTVKDNTIKLCSDIQLIGGEGCTSECDPNDVLTLFPLLDDLSEEKPFVEYHTWKRTTKSGPNKGKVTIVTDLDGAINDETDKDWHAWLIENADALIPAEQPEQPNDPPPPTRSVRTAPATPPAESAPPARPARGSRTPAPAAEAPPAAPARNSRSAPTAPAAETPAPTTRRGGRAVPAPAPEPEPEPEPEPVAEGSDEWCPQPDDIYAVALPKARGRGKEAPTDVRVIEVGEEGNDTVKVIRLTDQKEFADIPFRELKDALDEIPF